jgi:hypothetical protein
MVLVHHQILLPRSRPYCTIEASRLKAIRDQDLKDASLSEQEKFLINFVGEANITKVVKVNLDKRGEASKKNVTDYIFELNKLLLEDEIKTQEELSKIAWLHFLKEMKLLRKQMMPALH